MKKSVKPVITVITKSGSKSYLAVGVCHCN